MKDENDRRSFGVRRVALSTAVAVGVIGAAALLYQVSSVDLLKRPFPAPSIRRVMPARPRRFRSSRRALAAGSRSPGKSGS